MGEALKLAAISDIHGQFVDIKNWPEADVLCIAGDYAPNGGGPSQLQWVREELNPFLAKLNYERIVIISGNHDFLHEDPETKKAARRAFGANVVYLEDEGYEYQGLKFYGSPYQPWFFDWAFNFPKHDPLIGYETAKRTWNKIPDDTDILITHGPPRNILDLTPGDENVGCPILLERVMKVKPKLHVFGHIHHSYGREERDGIVFGNVATCNEEYEAVNEVQVFEVEIEK